MPLATRYRDSGCAMSDAVGTAVAEEAPPPPSMEAVHMAMRKKFEEADMDGDGLVDADELSALIVEVE